MEAITSRLAGIFASEPDDAAKACAFLLVLYVTTFVPLLTWAIFKLNKRSRAPASLPACNELQVYNSQPYIAVSEVKIPSAEQTALLIRKRRSIFTKDLSGEKVDRRIVESMLEAANWAPTHGKTEPWRYVVMGPTELQRFIGVMIESIDPSASLEPMPAPLQSLDTIPGLGGKEQKAAKLNSKRSKMGGVQWAIVICYKRQAGEKLMPEWEELAATSMSVQNMHLQATAEGVAGYWTSWGPEEVRDSPLVKQYLGLDAEDKCIGVFLLGASNKVDSYRAKRGPIAEKVDWRA